MTVTPETRHPDHSDDAARLGIATAPYATPPAPDGAGVDRPRQWEAMATPNRRREPSLIMPRVKIGKQAAAYPPGYEVASLFRLIFYAPAVRSRGVRRFFWGLPASRFRTYMVGSYYHRLVQGLGESDFSFLAAVTEDAELTMFTMGTYQGREAWRQALISWRETLDVGLEVAEFINLGAGCRVLIEIRLTGHAEGLGLQNLSYLVVQVDDGQASRGQFFSDRAEAFEAAGLRE